MRLRPTLAALALAILPLLGAYALEPPESIRATWGVLVEGLSNPALESQVSTPSINFNFGAGVNMPFEPGSRFAFTPSADFYYFNAEWAGGQAVPTDSDASSAFVIGLVLNAPVVYSIPLSPKISVGAGLGLCLDIRAAITTYAQKKGDTPLMNAYFWDKARFLTPSTTLRFEYALSERVEFGFSGRILWPIYNLWTKEGYGFFDQGIYLIDLVIRYRLKPAAAAPAVEPAPTPAEDQAPSPAPAESPAPDQAEDGSTDAQAAAPAN
jgi:hypothetical protein